MIILTNCTFDGLVYNVQRFMEELLAIKPDLVVSTFTCAFCPLSFSLLGSFSAAAMAGPQRP